MKTAHAAVAATALFLSACAGAPNYGTPYGNPYGTPYGNSAPYGGAPYGNPYGAPYGNAGVYGGQAPTNTAGQGAMGALMGVAATMILQSIAQSVWSGAIGTQLAPQDQTFRQQSLVNLLQSGDLQQPQQWSNPLTGNSIAMTPLRQVVDPNTQQNCHELEETYYVGGQPIKEVRLACPDPTTGKWTLLR